MGLIIAAGIALGTIGGGAYLDYRNKGDALLVSLILALVIFNGYLAYSSAL